MKSILLNFILNLKVWTNMGVCKSKNSQDQPE